MSKFISMIKTLQKKRLHNLPHAFPMTDIYLFFGYLPSGCET